MSALVAVPQPFLFEGASIRVTVRGGEPWWVLADVCRVLGFDNATMAGRRLDDDERGVATVETPGGPQQVGIINESGVYSLHFTSRKAVAKRLKKWVTAEVLPTIRRTGSYGALDLVAMLNDPVVLRGLLASYGEKVTALEARVEANAPMVAFAERVVAAPDAISISHAAKILGTGRNRLVSLMRRAGWLTRTNEPYQPKINAGLLDVKLGRWEHPDRGLQNSVTALVTGKGLEKLRALVAAEPCRAVPRRAGGMSQTIDYDRRSPAATNVLFSAYSQDDPTNFRFLHVFSHERGVTIAFVEDAGCTHGLDVHDMIQLSEAQCEQLAAALSAEARKWPK